MTVNIPTGYAQVTYLWESLNFDSGKAATIVGYFLNGQTFSDLGTTLVTKFEDNLLPEINENISWVGLVAADNDTLVEVAFSEDGGRSGDVSPPNITVLEKKIGTLRGRANRGRNYWPGFLNDGDVASDGTIATGRWGDLELAFATFNNAMATADFNRVILHNDPVPDPTPVDSSSIEHKCATQRRRLRR